MKVRTEMPISSSKAEQLRQAEVASWLPQPPWRRYGLSLLLVVVATLMGLPFTHFLSPTNLAMPYLVAVVIAAVYLGRGPSTLAAALSVLAFLFFFVPPLLGLAAKDTEYVLTFIGLFVVGLVISTLAGRARERAEAAQRREAQTMALYELSRDLAAAAELKTILEVLMRHMEQIFGREVVVFLSDGRQGGQVIPYRAHLDQTLDEHELAIARWVLRHGELADRNRPTLPAAQFTYLPLKTVRGVVGVFGVRSVNAASHLTSDHRRLLDAFANQAALAIERAQLEEQAREAKVLQAAERLQTALLNSISHDLRPSLVSITGALSSLEEAESQLDEATRQSLVENAHQEAERLNQLVGNLLNMNRPEDGALKVSQELCNVKDMIGVALEQLGDRAGPQQITLVLPEDLPLVPMDFVLMAQVMVNLLENAVKYSPTAATVDVEARVAGAHLEIEVADHGPGIPPQDLEHVFNKFYREQRPGNVNGAGLGLAICKGIVEAHGGFIVAANRPGGGTVITVALPLK